MFASWPDIGQGMRVMGKVSLQTHSPLLSIWSLLQTLVKTNCLSLLPSSILGQWPKLQSLPTSLIKISDVHTYTNDRNVWYTWCWHLYNYVVVPEVAKSYTRCVDKMSTYCIHQGLMSGMTGCTLQSQAIWQDGETTCSCKRIFLLPYLSNMDKINRCATHKTGGKRQITGSESMITPKCVQWHLW